MRSESNIRVTFFVKRRSIYRVINMRRCKNCSVPIAFGAGLITAAILPTKAVCVIAALVLIFTCLSMRR